MSMKLLRLTPALKATSSSYNQFSLGFKNSIDQTVGSLHKHEVSIDENIRVFHGDGSPFLMITSFFLEFTNIFKIFFE